MTAESTLPAAPTKPRRLTLSEVVEHLLQRGSSEHSSIALSRNAKGETQIEVIVRTDDRGEVDSLAAAEELATATYSRLRALYPYGNGAAGGES